jgi:outer membrane protein OmpA-like peptidoglycan-associated protein
MPSRPVRWALVGIAFVALWLIAVAVAVPAIEDDLTDRVEQQLLAAGLAQVSVGFDGRDGTLRGPEAQREAALAAVTDRQGIRSLEYETGEPATSTTTLPGQVTVPSVVTTPDGTTTTTTTSSTTSTTTSTTTTTTTSTTVAPGPVVDAAATIAGQTVRLDGFVADDGQRQALLAAAAGAFTPQGEVVDQLAVQPSDDPAAGQSAVDALAEAIGVATSTLSSGTLRVTAGSLALPDGEAFSGAAQDRLSAALDDIGARNGVAIQYAIDPADNDEDDLQATLDVLVGRSGISFAPDSAELDSGSQATLDSVAEVLAEVPGPPIEVRGHTDSVGPADENQVLSEERAAAVVEYLVEQGVPADRLTATGAGETEPIAPNDTEEGRARNRRIELIVLEGG